MNAMVQFLSDDFGADLSAPRSIKPLWVECRGYRCLAYLDENSKWRTFATGKELNEVIEVCADNGEPTIDSTLQMWSEIRSLIAVQPADFFHQPRTHL